MGANLHSVIQIAWEGWVYSIIGFDSTRYARRAISHVRPPIVAFALFAITSTWRVFSNSALADTGEALIAVGHSDGGYILRASLGTQASVKAATIAMSTRLHHTLGSRPTGLDVSSNRLIMSHRAWAWCKQSYIAGCSRVGPERAA